MTYDLDEQEQLEAIKAWWERYGNFVLTVISVLLLAVAGWQGWNWYQNSQSAKAGGYFEALQTAAGQNNPDQVRDASTRLTEDYGKTAYAARGALVAAQVLEANGDTTGARQQLQWVVDNGGAALAPVARLRLAGLLLDQQEYDAALALLSNTPSAGFEALYADRRGDILFAQGKVSDARTEWQAALDILTPANPLASLVQLKLNALGGAAAKA